MTYKYEKLFIIMLRVFFFPLFLQVDEIKDSFGVINSREKPLAAYLFTNDENFKEDFLKSVSAGGVTINDTILHVSPNNGMIYECRIKI